MACAAYPRRQIWILSGRDPRCPRCPRCVGRPGVLGLKEMRKEHVSHARPSSSIHCAHAVFTPFAAPKVYSFACQPASSAPARPAADGRALRSGAARRARCSCVYDLYAYTALWLRATCIHKTGSRPALVVSHQTALAKSKQHFLMKAVGT